MKYMTISMPSSDWYRTVDILDSIIIDGIIHGGESIADDLRRAFADSYDENLKSFEISLSYDQFNMLLNIMAHESSRNTSNNYFAMFFYNWLIDQEATMKEE